MQEFLDSLKKGEFKIPVCASCKNTVWPPSGFCPRCLGPAPLKKIETAGTIVELANSKVPGKEGIFGLVRMSCGIKLVGSFDKELHEGMKVRMDRCGVANGAAFYHFVAAQSQP